MKFPGTLDGQPATFIYNSDGFTFVDVQVKIGEVFFDWEQLSVLQQEQVLNQLKAAWPTAEENYN